MPSAPPPPPFPTRRSSDLVALVEAAQVPYRTRARTAKQVRVITTREQRTWGPVTWAYGDLEVVSQVTGYDRRRLPGMETVGSNPRNLPKRTLPTTGSWCSVPKQVLTDSATVPG